MAKRKSKSRRRTKKRVSSRKPTRKRKRITRKRRPAIRRTRKRKQKRKAKKKQFGGYNLIFNGCEETLEEVFGRKPVTPAKMTKLLWKYIKKWKLGGKN